MGTLLNIILQTRRWMGQPMGTRRWMVGARKTDAMRLWRGEASSVSIHKVEKASTQTLTGTYGWRRGKEDGGNRHGEPTPPGIHVQVLPKMSHACLGSCEPHKPFHDNRRDFTARRLERSIVEKQELKREIFIHSKTIPQPPPTPPHTTEEKKNLKTQQEKKKKKETF